MQLQQVGAGSPVLLLHAFPLSGAMWAPQIAALAHTHHLIVPDLPGFGATAAPSASYSLDDVADSVALLLDQLHLERVSLVGLSMGGYIAFALLRRHPQRVSALVLADTRAGADSDQARAGREVNAQLAEREGVSPIADKMLPGLLSPAAPPHLVAHVRSLIVANGPTGIALALRAMAARPDSRDLLPAITVPTLVVVGANDTLTPPTEARAMHESIAGSQLAEIPAAGHLANLEQPEAFNTALAKFLSTASG